VKANRDNLLKNGFTLQEMDKDTRVTRDLTVRRTLEGLQSSAGALAEILTTSARVMDLQSIDDGKFIDSDHESSGSISEHVPDVLEETPRDNIHFRKDSSYRVKYDDPWKIHAGYRLGEVMGKTPNIVLWSGDGIRLQDPLPPRLLGPKWDGSPKSKVRFEAIVSHEVKLHVVYTHTHWGHRLHEMCNDPDSGYTSWARTLRRRINRFLNGSTDPCMSKSQVESLFESTECSRKARSLRFIELLKTVDGIFTQRYLCYPEEVWTWSRFDMFTLGNISYLIGDEFLDGVMTKSALSVTTAYAQLKASRKWFKEAAHRGTLEEALGSMNTIPHWCRQFARVWHRANSSTGSRRIYLVGILSQTRGCGTPPPLVLLQSKVKFLVTISKENPPEPASAGYIRRAALSEILKSLPDSAFTGLSTKARVTVTTSSSWEKTRKEGGTIEAAREILASLPVGEQVPIRNLETGRLETYKSIGDFESIGEAVFWLSLDHTLRSPPDLLKQAFLTMVKEPGKARTVTKARACLKIVLDLVNKLCSSPLEKGIRSSTSGMGKANHGWNLFCRLMSDEVRDMVFSLDSREENPYEGYIERIDTFKDLFMSSTDYKEATDQLLHVVAADLGGAWMQKCGIPRLLRALVHKTCFSPRDVFFHADGVLEGIGIERPEYGEKIRSVRLVNGILMGDPLTKVVLHLTNVVTRHVGSRLHDRDFYDHFPNGAIAYEKFRVGLGKSRAQHV